MGYLRTVDQASVITNQTIVTTNETVVVTSPQIELVNPNGFVAVQIFATITPGTNSTAVTFRIRRGTTISGTLIGNPQALVLSAGNQTELGFCSIDTYSLLANATYVATVQMTGASANSTVQEANILVFAF